jgi:hypothetical protein
LARHGFRIEAWVKEDPRAVQEPGVERYEETVRVVERKHME